MKHENGSLRSPTFSPYTKKEKLKKRPPLCDFIYTIRQHLLREIMDNTTELFPIHNVATQADCILQFEQRKLDNTNVDYYYKLFPKQTASTSSNHTDKSSTKPK